MKGEAHMHETIIAVFLVTIMLLLGIIVFTQWTNKQLEKVKFEYKQEQFELLIGKIPNIPEFSCSTLGQEKECIDSAKLLAFKEVNLDYNSIFGYVNITIFQVYPMVSGECTKSNHLACNTYNVYYKKKTSLKNRFVISSPVSLYKADTGEYSVGKLVVEWYT